MGLGLAMSERFSPAYIISRLGENIVVSGITKTLSSDGYGDATETESGATCRTVVQELSAEDEAVVEGFYRPGDIEIFIDETDSNISKWIQESVLSWRGFRYRVKEVLREQGHYKAIAKKE